MFALKLKNTSNNTLSSLSNFNANLKKTNFSMLTIRNTNKKINNYNNNIKLIKIKSFLFTENQNAKEKKTSEFDKHIKKEIEKADKEREKQKKIEEWKKLKNSIYTKEEFLNVTKDKEEIILIEISDKNRKKLKFFKNMCLFFNIPVSLFITFFIDSILPTYVPGNKKHVALWYGLMATDYILFVNGVLILSALANICLNAKYLPKENMMEFTKLNILNKPFIVKEKVEIIKRTNAGLFSPFNSLKSKATNQVYALKGIGEWKDIKLYNYLFPFPVVRTEKTEMRDVKKRKIAENNNSSNENNDNKNNNKSNNNDNIKI